MQDIVFVTVDSLRADHVGWHGYERETTPFLDELAEESHKFLSAFANGECTRTSFPAIMTSVYASRFGGKSKISERQTPVAEPLSANGYVTAGFHSNPHLLPKFGYDRGFDRFYDSNSEPSRLARLRQWVKDNLDQSGLPYRAIERLFAFGESAVGFNPGTPFVPADEITSRAVRWAETTDDGPRFLWVHYMDVHHPYSPPETYQREFRDTPVSEREAVKLRRKMLKQPAAITDVELQKLIDLYDGEIRFVDSQVRRLVESLRDVWGGDPVVVFTADHGDEFRDHGQFSHLKTLYDELLHVPLLMYTGPSSGTYDDVVELVDIPPTLLSMAGFEIPSTYEGIPLQRVFEDRSRGRDYAITDAGDELSYRDGRWKLIDRSDSVELYDIQTDPGEHDNVADKHPDVVSELTAVLETHRRKTEETDEDLGAVHIDGTVQDRMEQLGYLQE